MEPTTAKATSWKSGWNDSTGTIVKCRLMKDVYSFDKPNKVTVVIQNGNVPKIIQNI